MDSPLILHGPRRVTFTVQGIWPASPLPDDQVRGRFLEAVSIDAGVLMLVTNAKLEATVTPALDLNAGGVLNG